MIFRFFRKAKDLKKKYDKKKHLSLAGQKAMIREAMNDRWFSLTKKERRKTSRKAEERLALYLGKIKAKNVLFYASMEDVPSTDEILDTWLKDDELTLILTRVCNKTKQLDPYIVRSWDDIEIGRFRIRMPKKTCEPIDLAALDAIVVPGRAFSLKKNRVGRGFGFYDRFLCVVPEDVKRIGLAFEFQLVSELPTEVHDMPMDVIITEKRIIE